MIKAFFWSKKWALWAYGGGFFLISLVWLQVNLLVKLNYWRRGFYDMMGEISKHTINEFYAILTQFFYIALPLIGLGIVLYLATRIYGFLWREALTKNYLPRWGNVTEKIEGESQRLQEDPKLFAAILESLGLQAIRAILTLIAFIPVLWELSKGIDIWFMKNTPGSLMWAALFVTIGGTAISWLVGIKLRDLQYNNQVVEAAFRKELVLCEDDLLRRVSLTKLFELFTGVKRNYFRLYLHLTYYDLWVSMYDQTMFILPFIVMAPRLFAGVITFGIVMQALTAFDEVRSSFALFIYNWTDITEYRSIRKRLREFEINLDKYQA